MRDLEYLYTGNYDVIKDIWKKKRSFGDGNIAILTAALRMILMLQNKCNIKMKLYFVYR